MLFNQLPVHIFEATSLRSQGIEDDDEDENENEAPGEDRHTRSPVQGRDQPVSKIDRGIFAHKNEFRTTCPGVREASGVKAL